MKIIECLIISAILWDELGPFNGTSVGCEVSFRLESFPKHQLGENVKVILDSMVVYYYIRNGGGRKKTLNLLTKELLLLEMSLGIRVLIPEWVPTYDNIADEPSRWMDMDDWTISVSCFACLMSIYNPEGLVMVDRFADATNTKMQEVQQSDVLSGDGSGGCFLSRLGRGKRGKLVGSTSEVDPKNPFVCQRDTSKGSHGVTRMEESSLVADAGGNVIGGSDSFGGQGLCPWSEQCYRTVIEPFMEVLSLPHNWQSLSPKAIRPALVVKRSRFSDKEFPLRRCCSWASRTGLTEFLNSIERFLSFAKGKDYSPDSQIESVHVVKEFLSYTEFDHLVGIHVQLAFSMCKLWHFNPVVIAASDTGEESSVINSRDLRALIEKGRSEATSKNYAREWNGYFSFANNNKLKVDDHNTVCEYAASLWSAGLISKAIAAINAVNKASVLLDWESSPAEAPRVKEVKRALYRLKAESTAEFKRDPLPTQALVNFLLQVVEQGLEDEPYFQQCCLLLLVSFRLMLRAKSLSLLKIKDIVIKDWGLDIALAPIKSMQSWQRKHIEKSSDWRLCPAYWFKKYTENLDRGPESLLFVNPKNGKPITSIFVTELVRKVAKSSKCEGDFSSHSLRIGGATAAALGGLSVTQIQAIGGWESLAVLRYIRSLIGISKKVSERMGLVVPPSDNTSVSSV